MTEEENIKVEVDDDEDNELDSELAKLRQEMKEIKEMLSEKQSEGFDDTFEPPHAPRAPRAPRRPKTFTINFDNMDIDSEEFGDFGHNIGEYLKGVTSGLNENLRSSMAQMARGFRFVDNLDHTMQEAKRGAAREMRKAQKDLRKEARRATKAAKKHHRDAFVFTFKKLSKEELEQFYEKAPDLMSGLSDKRRLQILKELETGPKYQGDLSDATGMKGGTFKHHMDTLLSSKFVYQEATRGRYLITQLGMEALKLAEMVYRRFYYEEKKAAGEDEGIEVDTEFEVSISEDDMNAIDDSVDALDDELEAIEDEIDEMGDQIEEIEDELQEEEELREEEEEN